jgi:hypothetical protein
VRCGAVRVRLSRAPSLPPSHTHARSARCRRRTSRAAPSASAFAAAPPAACRAHAAAPPRTNAPRQRSHEPPHRPRRGRSTHTRLTRPRSASSLQRVNRSGQPRAFSCLLKPNFPKSSSAISPLRRATHAAQRPPHVYTAAAARAGERGGQSRTRAHTRTRTHTRVRVTHRLIRHSK